jgi:transposase
MEDVLNVYHRPYDPLRPLICFDECLKQLVKDVTPPIAAVPGQVARIDNVYERNGTGNVFMFSEPLAGRRYTQVTAQRTAKDYAHAIRYLLDVVHPTAEKVVLLQDNLNTHKPASLYQAFEPEVARQLIDRLEIHYIPKHGSWLNMAEIELGVLGRQCLDQRIPDLETLKSETAAWNKDRNAKEVQVNWQFTTADARIKLKRLYPILEPLNPKLADH